MIVPAGGGLYWPVFIGDRVDDEPVGRDYKRGIDSNAAERAKLIERIVGKFPESQRDSAGEVLKSKSSPLKDITEYGRMVHAEMEALLACAGTTYQVLGQHCIARPFLATIAPNTSSPPASNK